MSHTSRTGYFVLIGWMLVGSTLRIVWFLSRGLPIDALPIITIVLALAALVHAFRPLPRPQRRESCPPGD